MVGGGEDGTDALFDVAEHLHATEAEAADAKGRFEGVHSQVVQVNVDVCGNVMVVMLVK